MSRFLRLLAAASIAGALAILLRELFRERPELLGSASSDQGEGAHTPEPKPDRRDTTNHGPGQSKEMLYEEAQRLGIKGRSKMKKGQLERAIKDAKAAR